MSEFMREALPIIFMYGCVALLGPFVAIAMWMAFDGDRDRSGEASETTVAAPSSSKQASHPREARSAA